jgi:signal transduction histidine kinase
MNIPTKRAHLCSFCGPGITHIIDPVDYPNDNLAVLTDQGWKCGNCVERELDDDFMNTAPYSDPKRYQEIKEKRKKEETTKQQLENSNKELAAANERLKEADKIQKEFINVAAHELRTPIQPILGLSAILQPQTER